MIGQWITETQTRKLAAGARLRATAGTRAELIGYSANAVQLHVHAAEALVRPGKDR